MFGKKDTDKKQPPSKPGGPSLFGGLTVKQNRPAPSDYTPPSINDPSQPTDHSSLGQAKSISSSSSSLRANSQQGDDPTPVQLAGRDSKLSANEPQAKGSKKVPGFDSDEDGEI